MTDDVFGSASAALRLPKLAFVIPWYGPEIPGGAENLCREWAEHLAEAGFEVEVLTTTIKEFQSNWNESYHKPGEYPENGVLVRRFPLRRGDHSAFNYINDKLLRGIPITPDEESKFLTEGPNSESLIDFIEAHRSEYLFFFIPYLFGTTYWGTRAAGRRSVLIPCLHDESYARMAAMREMFVSAGGVIFNSHPEQSLAERLYGLKETKKLVLGMGLDTKAAGNAEAFRNKFGQKHPFILYVGRKDRTKNTDLLLEYFAQYKRDHPDSPLQLLLVGKGDLRIADCGFRIADFSTSDSGLRIADSMVRDIAQSESLGSEIGKDSILETKLDEQTRGTLKPETANPPICNPKSEIRNREVHDLGFLKSQDKYNAYAAATVLCNPSTNESFSIVLMESWLCGTPVLVNSACAVTRDYVERSQGGLHFTDYYDFEACLECLLQESDLRKAFATAGAEFVRANFSWETLIARFSEWLKDFV
ncbi:MAG TPA: glycosyltransferase family 4 protein [Acidobacteriota bacterium]|jgi:glycosyltransferase involved in cell wall biosynthesis